MLATHQEDDINMSDTTTHSTTLDIDSDNEQKTSQQQKKRKTSRYSPYQSQNTSNEMTTTIEKTTKSGKFSLPPTITNMISLNTTQTKTDSTQARDPIQTTEIFPHSAQNTNDKYNKDTNQNIDVTLTADLTRTNIHIKTYSQAVAGPSNSKPNQHPDLVRLIETWMNSTRQVLSLLKVLQFDKDLQNQDRIIAAFSSLTEFQKLIEYKLQTKPT